MNNPITSTEIEAVVKKKKLPENKNPGPDGFTSVFYQTPRKELTLLLLKLFQKLQSKTLPHSFYEATIIPIPTKNKYH